MKINEIVYARVLLHAEEYYKGEFTLIKKPEGYYFCFEQCWAIASDILDNMAYGETAEEAMVVGYANDTYYRECDICFNHELNKEFFTEKVRQEGYIKYMSISQAEKRWRKHAGTIRLDCERGIFEHLVRAGGLVQQIADIWLISEEALKLVYGERNSFSATTFWN